MCKSCYFGDKRIYQILFCSEGQTNKIYIVTKKNLIFINARPMLLYFLEKIKSSSVFCSLLHIQTENGSINKMLGLC
ncbi:hypothetical protein XELAEV_18010400mg [Xenopus laevis]|uniref:Uncharacterized protein n=1 Tax=Xenopus laevis TaxID=8355 RepID=A0A974DVB6_XENLA|nr:hypothetical protein XELAEV_18010400mg [Xenopus laevis]